MNKIKCGLEVQTTRVCADIIINQYIHLYSIHLRCSLVVTWYDILVPNMVYAITATVGYSSSYTPVIIIIMYGHARKSSIAQKPKSLAMQYDTIMTIDT